jgi:hypothetical protein
VAWHQDTATRLTDVWRPVVYFDALSQDDRFRLWFRNTTDDVEMASSRDGRSWRKHGVVLSKGNTGAFDDLAVAPGAVIPVDSGYSLLYEAVDRNLRFSGGLAFSRSWNVPLEKVGTAPVLEPDRVEAFLTKRAVIGDTALRTTDARRFRPGMTVYVIDKRGRWSTARIRDASANGVVLAESLPLSFEVDDGTVVRSFAFSKVYPSSILRDRDEWVVFATAFDPELGIASAGIESMAMLRGRDLRELRWDIENAPPLPLRSSSDTSWDSASRENLSTIDLKGRSLAVSLAGACIVTQ